MEPAQIEASQTLHVPAHRGNRRKPKKGEWIGDMIKLDGVIDKVGKFIKGVQYLHPIETIFLMETNMLLVFMDGIEVSIQRAYEEMLKYTQMECFIVRLV
jgi:hypothetical protein